ncbi:MAG: transglutaminase domain-containing protein [Oscillospiraceae bacterium]|nr:transglutaminase domain-containing protein [Oscillospiraceae bacterium]
MRGRAFLALVLLLALLSGCGWMDGSYVSVTPHQVGLGQTGEGTVPSVRSYTELRGALIGMIDSGTEKALFSLAEYPREEVPEDLQRAVAYAQGIYPVGAYAVETIDYNFGTGLGASALSVDITYRRSRAQIEGIRTVRWTSGAKKEVEDALDQFADTLVLQIAGYQETDFSAIIQDYAQRNPDRVMEVPGVSVRTFPDQGETRVVELSFHYRTDRSELRAMREQVQPVFSSAALYVSGGAGEWTKFNQLHTFLTERFDAYTNESTITPAYSLLCQGVGDSRAFSQVYAAMCSRIGLEARVVSGKRDGELRWWNLVRIDGSWYHLDLLASGQFAPLTDELMTGYEWDRTVYPAAPSPGA